MESMAASLLTRAVNEDREGRFTEALVCYQEGIQLLMDVRKVISNERKKSHLLASLNKYMERAEKIKEHIEIQKQTGEYHEQIHIENNATGYGYDKIFNRFVDATLTSVEVEDPYIRNVHQIYNFLRFCELLVSSHSGVSQIRLLTGRDEGGDNHRLQTTRLHELANSLCQRNVTLQVEFSETLHDREIRFNNGWVIKIGRGLDYFKPPSGKFVLGYCDFNLRPCHATTVDIFHRKHVTSR